MMHRIFVCLAIALVVVPLAQSANAQTATPRQMELLRITVEEAEALVAALQPERPRPTRAISSTEALVKVLREVQAAPQGLVQADISVGNPPLLNVIGIGLQTKSISQWMRSGRAAEREWHRLCVDLSELLMSSSYARSEPLEIPNCPGAAANIALALTTFRTAQAQRDAVYNRYRAASSNEVLNNLTAGRVQSIPDNPWTRLQLGAMAMAFADSGCGLTEEELTKAHVSADVFSVVAITRFVTSDNPVNAVSLRAQPEYALILGRVAAQTQKCKDPSVRSFMTNLVVTLGRLS